MKTKEELNALKEELENLNQKLAGLSDEELLEVTSGREGTIILPDGHDNFWHSWNPADDIIDPKKRLEF